ncbi:NAD(P)-binding protein [Gyrodon lividus]|nr:NAD(P)-binding protein [Gyrodon lividus]
MATAILEELGAKTLFDLEGVVAVVTGGNSGVGLMISSTLVANGATVYIVGLVQRDLDEICQKYNDAARQCGVGGKMIGIQGDVRHKSEAKRIAKEIGKREEHVTILFNNAGVQQGDFKPPATPTAAAYVANFFDSIEQVDFDNTFNTNVVGPYWLSFAFLHLLEKCKDSANPKTKKFVPQIVMTSSVNGWTKDSDLSRSYAYMFSKSAIGHFTSSLAHELLPLGIRVNGIAPGFFPSQMSAPGSIDPATGVSLIPPGTKLHFVVPTVQTGGTHRDMGSIVLSLVANWYINGETVLVDGGLLLKHPSSY